MPYRRKDSPYWWISFRNASGKKINESSGTANQREAKALEEARRTEARKARSWKVQVEPTFDEVLVTYLEAHQGKRSAQRDKYSARRLMPAFSGLKMSRISGQRLREYRHARAAEGATDSTVRKELSLLSSACNYCRQQLEWNIENPTTGRMPKEPPGRVRWITRAEADALIHAAEALAQAPLLADFIQLALHTGMRSGELLGLEWSRVDMGRGIVYLGAEHQKSGKHGSVPLNANARDALVRLGAWRVRYCPASPWVFCHKDGSRVQSVKRGFASACRAAGIEDFTPHDLRHTCAAWLVQMGTPLIEACHLLRHSDIRMTMRYAHLAPENVRSAVERLEGKTDYDLTTLREGPKKGRVSA